MCGPMAFFFTRRSRSASFHITKSQMTERWRVWCLKENGCRDPKSAHLMCMRSCRIAGRAHPRTGRVCLKYRQVCKRRLVMRFWWPPRQNASSVSMLCQSWPSCRAGICVRARTAGFCCRRVPSAGVLYKKPSASLSSHCHDGGDRGVGRPHVCLHRPGSQPGILLRLEGVLWFGGQL